LLEQIYHNAVTIEAQPFRNEGKAVLPWSRERDDVRMRSAVKSSNTVPSAEHKMKYSRWCLRSSRVTPRSIRGLVFCWWERSRQV